MPLTYSIANGIGAGFISWVVMRSLVGQGDARSARCCGSSRPGFLIYFARGGIESLIGM